MMNTNNMAINFMVENHHDASHINVATILI